MGKTHILEQPENSVEKAIQIKRRARRFAQQGAIPEALLEYERLFDAGEFDPYDYVAAGDLHARAGEVEGAIERYRQAAGAYAAIGLTKNAIAVLKKVLRTDASRREVHRQLGELYAVEGFRGDAVRHFLEFARGQSPEDPLVAEALQQADALLNADAESLEVPLGAAAPPAWVDPPPERAERAIVSVRDDEPVPEVPLVDLESLIGELTEGLKHQIAKNDHRSHYDLGVSHLEMGLFEEAISEFDEAAGDPSLRLLAIEMAGVCFLSLGQPDEAVRRLGQGLAVSGHDERELVGLRYHLGRALERAGRPEEAERQFTRVRDVDAAFFESQRRNEVGEAEALDLE